MRLTGAHERLLIGLVALHSMVVGTALTAAPHWVARLGGWEAIAPALFGRLSGVFLIALAAGYLVEYARRRGICLILLAKSFAFAFLMVHALLDPLPPAILASGLLDGLMALVVWWVHEKVEPPSTDHP